jgi:hypothetical protein
MRCSERRQHHNMITKAQIRIILESGVLLALAILFLGWRDPNMPLAVHLLPPLGFALWAVESLLSRSLSARKRTALTIIGMAVLMCSVSYDVLVMPGVPSAGRIAVILMLALVTLTAKPHAQTA